MIPPSIWMRYVVCSLLVCVGGFAGPLACKLADFRQLESIWLLSEDIPENISHSVKMTTRWESDLLSSKTSCLCSWWGINVQKHYMGRLECGKSVTFTIWHCLAKSCLWNPVFTFPISLPLALMQGKSSCCQEGKRKEEGRGASRAGGMTVSYIAHCELAINPGCRNYWNGEIVIS